MTSLVLSRMSFVGLGSETEVDQGSREVANKLATEFGYNGHIRKLNFKQIAAKLTQIGCAPFSTSSVERYKRWMSWKATGLPMAVFFTVVTVMSLATFIHYCNSASPSVFVIVPALAGMVVSAITTIAFWCHFGEVTARWETQRIGGYDKVVPEDAVKKMLRIKETFPTVSFSVEELIVEKVVRDPFLVALIDGYKFHVAVWDEPEYVPHI